MKQQHESNQGKPDAIPVERSEPAIAPGSPQEGSKPSNTDPSNCKVLRMGVDSLYLSFAGDLTDEGRTKLELARDAARSGLDEQEAKAQVSILDHHLKASPSAGKLFRYLISDHAFRIQLKRQGQTHCALAYGKIASHYLTAAGVESAANELRLVLSSLAMVEPGANVSRIDLFADFVSPHALDSWDDNAWVSRAKYLDRHRQGQVCTGWTIGRGGIVLARLYDKTVQVLASGQDYLYDLWRAQGWDGQSSVYRIEFQFRAEALRPMGCNRYPEVLDQLGGLWRYATEKWLRLTIPSADDTTRSRWPTHPMWEALQSHPWTPCEPVSRIPIPDGKCPSLARVYSSYAAALTSFMATEGIENPHDAFQWLHEKSQRYYDERAQFTGQDFETFILGRASRKALDYGKPFEFTTQRARDEQIEAIARQYRDESRR